MVKITSASDLELIVDALAAVVQIEGLGFSEFDKERAAELIEAFEDVDLEDLDFNS